MATGELARLQRNAGLLSAAEQNYRKKVDLLGQPSLSRGADYAKALLDLGSFYLDVGRTDEASAPLRQALDLARQQWAGDSQLAYFYNQVGRLDMSQGRFEEAEAMLKTALAIRRARNVDPSLLATSLDNLGNFYLSRGNAREAEPHLLEALGVFRSALGPSDPDTLICVANVAELYARTDRTPQALVLLTKSLEDLPAERHSSKVDLLRQRGKLLVTVGQFAAAQADLGYAIDLASQSSRLSPTLVELLIEQASVSKQLNLLEQGEALLKRAEGLVDARPVANRSTLVRIWALRGWFEWQLRNLPEAIGYLERVVADARIRGPAQLSVALIDLAIVQTQAGALDPAQSNVQEAIKLLAAQPPESVNLAECYNVLGSILERRGQLAAAEVEYRRSLAIVQRVRPASDPRVVNVQSNLGLLLVQAGHTDEALKVARVRAAAFEEGLRNLLNRAGEEEARAYVRSQNPFSLFASIGQAAPLANAVFNYQSVVTDAMTEWRTRRRSPEQREAFDRWRDARSALTQWVVSRSSVGVATGDRLAANLAAAQAAYAHVGGQAGSSIRFDLRNEDVADRLPTDAALVNYLRYSKYLGQARQEEHYGALVMTRETRPVWIPLGKAADIEPLAGVYSRAVRGRDPNPMPSVLRELHRQLLAPVLERVPRPATRLLVIPDGEINLISLAALVDDEDGQFVGEKYSVSYLSSARALVGSDGPRDFPERKAVRIYASPRFAIARPKIAVPPLRADESLGMTRGFDPPKLLPLPFTLAEASAVRSAAAQRGWQVTVVSGAAATERDLRAMSPTPILHFATHGLWLPRFGTELSPSDDGMRGIAAVAPMPRAPPGRSGSKVPVPDRSTAQAWREGSVTSVRVLSAHDPDFSSAMLRSVVALAGAQDTLEGWRAGRVPPSADDGVLTAEEASMLDLHETWLVTLSSCDSGVGEPEPGEGVIGLQRGFLEAGAKNVLTTLWPVSDAWTPRLMTEFYSEALKTRDASRALANAQRRMLVQLRAKYGVEVAARLAGAFVLVSREPSRP
jgi:CHAT domain-containing protein/tetratricopeptide (TPR) repeat protein